MRRLIYFTQHQPLLVVFTLLVFIGGGILAFRGLPIEAFPDVSDTQVTVIALASGSRGRGSRAAGDAADRSRAIGPARLGAAVLAHPVRAVVHGHHVQRPADRLARAPARRERLQNLTAARGRGNPHAAAPDRDRRDLPVPAARRRLSDAAVARDPGLGGREASCARCPALPIWSRWAVSIKQYEVNPDMARLRDYGLSLGQLFEALAAGQCQCRWWRRHPRARSST